MNITNTAIIQHSFLVDMYNDAYFPKHCVDLVKQVILKMCQRIEAQQPKDLDELYVITAESTQEINELQGPFEDAGSEIETVARETISSDFLFVAQSYGFLEADIESVVMERDW